MFSVVFRFSSPVSLNSWEVFHKVLILPFNNFHAQQSSRLKKEVFVITWPSEPERRAPEAEVTWQQSFRISPWSPLTSIVTPYSIKLSLRAVVLSHPTHLTTYGLDSLLPMQSEGISSYGNYLCFVHLSRNEVITSRVSLDGMEFERLVERNQTCSSLVQTSALSLVLVRITG